MELLALISTMLLAVIGAVPLTFSPPESGFLVKIAAEGQTSAEDLLGESKSQMFPFLVHGRCPGPNQVVRTSHVGFKSEVPLSTLVFQESAESGRQTTCGLKAYLVNDFTTQDLPVLRVLLHLDKQYWTEIHNHLPVPALPKDPLCVTVYANFMDSTVHARCELSLRDHAPTCVATMVLPLHWWSQLSERKLKPTVQVGFVLNLHHRRTALHSSDAAFLQESCNAHSFPMYLHSEAAENVQPPSHMQIIGQAHLMPKTAHTPMSIDKVLNVLVPDFPVRVGMVFALPIFMDYDPFKNQREPPYLFVLKCQVKDSLRILGVEGVRDTGWKIDSVIDHKEQSATVNAFYRDVLALNESWSGEVFTILYEVVSFPNATQTSQNKITKEHFARTQLVWSVRYVVDDENQHRLLIPPTNETEPTPTEKVTTAKSKDKLRTPHSLIQGLEIWKEAVVAIVPVAAQFDLVNTALITSRQVSESLRIFSVTSSGQARDVTPHSNCLSMETSVLKVRRVICTRARAHNLVRCGRM